MFLEGEGAVKMKLPMKTLRGRGRTAHGKGVSARFLKGKRILFS